MVRTPELEYFYGLRDDYFDDVNSDKIGQLFQLITELMMAGALPKTFMFEQELALLSTLGFFPAQSFLSGPDRITNDMCHRIPATTSRVIYISLLAMGFKVLAAQGSTFLDADQLNLLEETSIFLSELTEHPQLRSYEGVPVVAHIMHLARALMEQASMQSRKIFVHRFNQNLGKLVRVMIDLPLSNCVRLIQLDDILVEIMRDSQPTIADRNHLRKIAYQSVVRPVFKEILGRSGSSIR